MGDEILSQGRAASQESENPAKQLLGAGCQHGRTGCALCCGRVRREGHSDETRLAPAASPQDGTGSAPPAAKKCQ